MSFDVQTFREQFPILKTHDNCGKPLIYFDNAATTQLPHCVIDAISDFFWHHNSNVHRGIYELGSRAEGMYESARADVARYINASSADEIIFNSGTTEGINFIAEQFRHLTPDDEILISIQEHHSNILPWQRLSATVQFVSMTPTGDFDFEDFERKLSRKTKIVSIAHIHNVLGTINPIQEIAKKIHSVGALLIVDGAQSLAHGPVDVQQFECDLFVASAHKCFGPTGAGFLYGKKSILQQFSPYRLGGGMVHKIFTDKPPIYRDLPHLFEAGTPNLCGVIGLHAAIQFLQIIDWPQAEIYSNQLKTLLIEHIVQHPNAEVLKPNNRRIGIVSFIHQAAHPHDIASIFDSEGIAVRAGNHCASPLMQFLNVSGCVRASLGLYNTIGEIEVFAKTMKKIDQIFSKKMYKEAQKPLDLKEKSS